MKITSAIEVAFYNYFFIFKLEKEDIQNRMDLTHFQYLNLVKHVKRMEKPSLNTDTLEALTLQRLHENPSDKEVWKNAIELWKFKHKIPQNTESESNINLGDLLDGADQSVP